MSDDKQYITLLSSNEFKLKEKGSVFTGYADIAESESDAGNILEKKRKEFFDATHNCYAYKLFDGTEKYSDDGEPNGTAGLRILNAINHFDLVNLIVIVTRYFGGTKLGVGPLGKAYYDTAFTVLESATKKKRRIFNKLRIIYDYDQTKNIYHFLEKYNAKLFGEGFDELPWIECYILPTFQKELETNLLNASSGKTKLVTIEKNILL